jgi:hypothetical protein
MEDDDLLYNHPLLHLGMGLIEACTMIVLRTSLPGWTAEGWTELLGYRDFMYIPEESETVIARRPDTLAIRGVADILGVRIEGYSPILGSYGMGGPGFFGILLQRRGTAAYREYLVTAVWGAEEYLLLDNRVVGAHPRYHEEYHPWLGITGEGRHSELDAVLIGASIASVEVNGEQLRMVLVQQGTDHILEFGRHDERLPPMGSGIARKVAFTEGTITDRMVFQPENAILWV